MAAGINLLRGAGLSAGRVAVQARVFPGSLLDHLS